jgi:hypothetical protein
MKPSPSLEDLKETIELFLLEHSRPLLSEPGHNVVDMAGSSYSLSLQYDKLLWHVWSESSNLVRQITGIHKQSPGRLELRYQRFGKGPAGTLVLADSRARPEQLDRRSRRTQYLRELQRWLSQLFPQWKVEELTTEPDLARSFSGRYARGVIARGNQAWALIGSGDQEDPSGADDILAYGLIWLDWLRERNHSPVIEGLKIFLPRGCAETTAARLAWMNPKAAKWELYETSHEIGASPVLRDAADFGNLKTSLPCLSEPPNVSQARAIGSIAVASLSPHIEARTDADGACSWSLRGIPFARETSQGVVFGLGRAETVLEAETAESLRRLVQKIDRYRAANSPDVKHPLYRLQPERWMESALRQELDRIEFELAGSAIYEQVPTVSGTVRGVLDLLAANAAGRLVVMELKASEDMQLPLQALDYWMRVHWHHQRGELKREGYFRGRTLSLQTPLLLLVSPALQFHPAVETVMRYLSPGIEAVCVGLNENWREKVQVVFRGSGAPSRLRAEGQLGF